MACFVKLKEDCYVLWSKTADTLAERKLYNKMQVLAELTTQQEVLDLMGQPSPLTPQELIQWLEDYGTTDLGKSVDKFFVA